jgi:hypothetical protein
MSKTPKTIDSLKSQLRRKPRIGPAGALTPITQLKLRSLDDREWAAGLANSLSRADAVAEIKNRLGIDLKWETAYSRFLQWQEQEHRLQEYLESIQQRQKSGQLRKSASTQECRASYTNQLMDEALRHNDTKTFIGAARVSIADTRVAQQIRKMDLASLRLKLDQQRLEWEIKKHKLSLPPKPPRKRKMSAAEKRRRIRQILGTGPETPMPRDKAGKHNKTHESTNKTPTNEQAPLPATTPAI